MLRLAASQGKPALLNLPSAVSEKPGAHRCSRLTVVQSELQDRIHSTSVSPTPLVRSTWLCMYVFQILRTTQTRLVPGAYSSGLGGVTFTSLYQCPLESHSRGETTLTLCFPGLISCLRDHVARRAVGIIPNIKQVPFAGADAPISPSSLLGGIEFTQGTSTTSQTLGSVTGTKPPNPWESGSWKP